MYEWFADAKAEQLQEAENMVEWIITNEEEFRYTNIVYIVMSVRTLPSGGEVNECTTQTIVTPGTL